MSSSQAFYSKLLRFDLTGFMGTFQGVLSMHLVKILFLLLEEPSCSSNRGHQDFVQGCPSVTQGLEHCELMHQAQEFGTGQLVFLG